MARGEQRLPAKEEEVWVINMQQIEVVRAESHDGIDAVDCTESITLTKHPLGLVSQPLRVKCEAGAPEPKVTKEMIRAGQLILGDWFQTECGTAILLKRLYRAMKALEPRSHQKE